MHINFFLVKDKLHQIGGSLKFHITKKCFKSVQSSSYQVWYCFKVKEREKGTTRRWEKESWENQFGKK